MTADTSDLWAVVPVKDLTEAKQRLAKVLSPEQRRSLFQAMLEDVLTTLSNSAALSGILVITRDPWAKQLAEYLGASVLIETENLGQTAAVTAAAEQLAADGIGGMLTIPGDVPLITSAEVAEIIKAHGTAPAVTIVPARDELGSNAVACSPPTVMPLRFGDNSFFPHLAAARQRGITPQIIKLPGLGLDIDHPDDLQFFLQQARRSRALDYLLAQGLSTQ